MAIVKPKVKGKLDQQCVNSFRQVSNLTLLSKMLENQFMEYQRAAHILPDNESAYSRLYSTETILFGGEKFTCTHR